MTGIALLAAHQIHSGGVGVGVSNPSHGLGGGGYSGPLALGSSYLQSNTTLKSFRHYKGGSYTLLMIGRSSEKRDEVFAIYVSHQTQQIWIRPWAMFNELVVWPDGVRRPRFTEWTPDDPATATK
jgi:hypothetical protein